MLGYPDALRRHQDRFRADPLPYLELGAIPAALLAGAAVVAAPSLAKLLIPLLVALVVIAIDARALVDLTVIAAFATLPANIDTGKDLGLVTVLGYEALGLVAVVYLHRVVRPKPAEMWCVGAFAVVWLVALLSGIDAGNDDWRIAREAQFLWDAMLGLYLATLVVRAGLVRRTAIVLGVVLWVSAGLILLASATGFELAGRAEAVSLGAHKVTEATRLITNTQMVSAAVLCALVAMFLLRVRLGAFAALAPPAALITLLSFSRNAILAIAVATVAAVLLARTSAALVRGTALLAAGAALVLIGLPVLGAATEDTPAGTWIEHQQKGFSTRVLAGVAQSSTTDSSLRARLDEDANLLRAIDAAPLQGHGLGYRYQAPFGPPDEFPATFGPSYAHNFYLWWLVKAGLVGMAGFAVFALVPVLAGIRSRAAPATAATAVSVALLCVSAVAPLPLDPVNSFLLGTVLGTALGLATTREATCEH